jgi:periplasmic protein TonB
MLYHSAATVGPEGLSRICSGPVAVKQLHGEELQMSYTSEKKRANPASMALAIGVNGSIILAVALSPIVAERIKPTPPTQTENIPIEPLPPEVDEQKPESDTKPIEKDVFVPRPETKTLPESDNDIRTGETETKGTAVADGKGGGETRIAEIVEPRVPLFNPARRDNRFARDFQPDYPPGLLQKEIEGTVSVRVLVGIDGRVREAQVVSATHPDFGKAAVKQAMRHWRFSPATRDGVPVEDWQTLSVRFTID